MEILKFYYEDFEHKVVYCSYAISDWYCKPAILESLAVKADCLFLTCTKYGCRQFVPKWHKDFPINSWISCIYKKDLPFLVIEFNNCADSKSFSDLVGFTNTLGTKPLPIYVSDDLPF